MDDDVRKVLLWLVERSFPPGKEPCNRCGHSRDDHRLDDALDLDVTDPKTPFRCVFPQPNGPAVQLCDCPDYVP